MYWTDVIATGQGIVDFRLMVEGWPHEWVTNPRITHATNADGRLVYPGLSYKGLNFSEQSVLRDAWPNCSGINFTIVPTDSNEDTLNSFTRDSRPSGKILDNIDVSDTTWTTRPSTFPAGVYHLATEAILCDGANNITRGYWNTTAQIHTPVDINSNELPLYSWPPAMDGRRCYLYAYGTSDSPDGDGNIIWRGVIARPPMMVGRDGSSWQISAQPITSVFDQTVGAGDSVEWRIRGVYHTSRCPMTLMFRSDSQLFPSTPPYVKRITGFYETNSEWAQHVNDELSAMIEAEDDTPLTDLAFTIENGHPTFIGSGTGTPYFGISVKDGLDGDTVTGAPAVDNSGNGQNGGELEGRFFITCGDKNGDFTIVGCNFLPPWGYPLPTARALIGSPQLGLPMPNDPIRAFAVAIADLLGITLPQTPEYDDPTDNSIPSNRLYLQSVDGLETGDELMVRNPDDDDEPPVLHLTNIDPTYRFIEIDTSHMGAMYFSDQMSMVRVIDYGVGTNWAGFMAAIVARAPEANLGLTPYITANDVNSSAWEALWEPGGYPFHDYWRSRVYRFVKPISIKEVLQPEFQVTGWMGRLESDGRFGVCQMPFVGASRTAQHTLTDDEILLPADGMFGGFPTWEVERDGLINIIYLRLGYSPLKDDTNPLFDYTLRMTQSISEHKSGEKAKQEIEPKSTESGGYTLKKRLERMPDAKELAEMVTPYLQTLSQDYAVVTVCVPFTKFNVLCGDIIEVTSRYIPNGLGGRGVTSKKAICIGREWDFDPANNRMGTLTLWFPRDSGKTAGYSPTGRITAQSNTSGNTWTITMSHLSSLNIAWSESGDGNVVKHFAAGDAVAVYEDDSTTPVVVYGEVDSVNTATDQITVTFTDGWTPGSSTWDLRGERLFEVTSYSDHQLLYAIVADTDGFLPDGDPGSQSSGRGFV
jgi:hypothetical protein